MTSTKSAKALVESMVAQGTVALKNPKATLADVAAAMVEVKPKAVETERVYPPVAPRLTITPEIKHALLSLPKTFGVVQPDARREVSSDENAALYAEFDVVQTIGKALKGREDAIKTTIKHHLDVKAEREGRADDQSPRDAAGHYVLGSKGAPEREPIPGANKEWSREYRAPKAAFALDGARLLQMYEDGLIDREQYLSMTREMRVFDEEKALSSFRKNPALLALVADLVNEGNPVGAVTVRDPK